MIQIRVNINSRLLADIVHQVKLPPPHVNAVHNTAKITNTVFKAYICNSLHGKNWHPIEIEKFIIKK